MSEPDNGDNIAERRGSTPSDEDVFDFSETGRRRIPLKLDTKVALSPQFQAVSMVPTPLIAGNKGVFPETQSYPPSPSPRVVSASLVPDSLSTLQSPILQQGQQTPRYHQNLRTPSQASQASQDIYVKVPQQPYQPQPQHPDEAENEASVRRGNSLLVSKRRNRPVSLNRSVSVGGPQRQPSTILHREPKAVNFGISDLPEEVYLAKDPAGGKTAWTRIKYVGKGSFSEVVLSRPAEEFLKPEYLEDVNKLVNQEIEQLESEEHINSRQLPHQSHASTGDNAVPSTEPRMLVAVKITVLDAAKTEAQLEYFKRDVDIMSTIPRHPSLMRMIGSSLDLDHHRRALFVLPYCCGGDLFDLIAKHRSKLSSTLIRRIFADACSAVTFLHSNLIVHRDIKLENVLLDVSVPILLNMEHPEQYTRPIAVLTDLGLARRIDPEDPTLTTRCGSDDYVPPEIMLGQPYDGRETDSWALGVLLYAMLEGRLPFDAPPHTPQHEGNRARLKTAHRIARVDWSWYKRKDSKDDNIWGGGKEIVEGCLKRRGARISATEIEKNPWVANARPKEVVDPLNVEDMWKLFVQ